jgi:hypothetical protein
MQKRQRPSRLLAAGLAFMLLPLTATAQGNGVSSPMRPLFAAATGLLETQHMTVDAGLAARTKKSVPSPFTIDLPESESIALRISEDTPGALSQVDFFTSQGQFVESLRFTNARVAVMEEERRVMAMANLLVLHTFPALQKRYADAQVHGFGNTTLGENDAVQIYGSFTNVTGERFFFRHVGFMRPESDNVVVGISTVRQKLMPVTSRDQFRNTYGGYALESFRFAEEIALAH